jgi:hypothetical protein
MSVEPRGYRLARGGSTHVLKAVNKSAIRSVAKLTHNVLNRHEVFDIYGWCIFEAVGRRGRIEVDEMTGTPRRVKVGHKRGAEGRLSSACWSCNKHSVAHCRASIALSVRVLCSL